MKNLSIFQPCFGLPLMTCCTLHSVWVVSVIFKSVLHGNRHDIQQPRPASQSDRQSASQPVSQRASETLKMPWKRYLCTFFFIIFFLASCKLSVDNYFIMLSTLKCNNANNIVLWQSQYLLCLGAFCDIFVRALWCYFFFFWIFGFFPRAVWNRSSFGRKIVGGS